MVDVHSMILRIKYQGSLCLEDFLLFLYVSLWPHGYSLNKIVRGPLGYATNKCTKYQGAMPSGLKVDVFYVFTKQVNVKYVTPGCGHFCPQTHYLNNIE